MAIAAIALVFLVQSFDDRRRERESLSYAFTFYVIIIVLMGLWVLWLLPLVLASPCTATVLKYSAAFPALVLVATVATTGPFA